jgi:hypothetical protein
VEADTPGRPWRGWSTVVGRGRRAAEVECHVVTLASQCHIRHKSADKILRRRSSGPRPEVLRHLPVV